MSLAWNPGAIPGLIALVTGWSMAILVYRTRPDRSQNRRLAFLLALEGTIFGSLALLLATAQTLPTAAGLTSVVIVGQILLPWVYLAFLATLDTPLVAWLDNRIATRALVVGAGLSVASFFAFRDLFIASIEPVPVLGGYDWSADLLNRIVLVGILAAALFGLVVAVSLYRRTSEGSARRSTARAYLAAFGVRDTLLFANIVYILALLPSDPTEYTVVDVTLGLFLPEIASILFALLLAYGILTTQLFDIDLKIKWTLEKSTVAAVFVAVFFAVSEGAQVLFAEFAGSEILGVAAAALLVFFMAPLQRLGERVSDAAMPEVEDTPAYREQRKRELYRAAVESAVRDEEITDKERDVLAGLQDELELARTDALAIERDVLGAGRGEA